MISTEPQPESPRRKLRWWQFSLRSLLVIMLLASIGMSWFAVRMQRARGEREAVKAMCVARFPGKDEGDRHHLCEAPFGPLRGKWSQSPPEILATHEAIEQSGGGVWYDYLIDDYDLGDDAYPNFAPEGKPLSNKWARRLFGDENLFTKVVTAHPRSDNAIEHLGDLNGLQVVWASSSQVTDAGLRHLESLSGLRELSLDQTAITDAGLEHLKPMTELQRLSLRHTRITDAGLEHLKGLHQLRHLDCARTRVTAQGCRNLWKVLPNLEITTYISLSQPLVFTERTPHSVKGHKTRARTVGGICLVLCAFAILAAILKSVRKRCRPLIKETADGG